MCRGTVVVHARARGVVGARDAGESRVGFVVTKAVGGAVVRNRAKRRLRALSRPLVMAMPAGCDFVVRGLPSVARVGQVELADDLTSAWAGAVRKAGLK